MDCIVHGITKGQTRLSDFHFTSQTTEEVSWWSSSCLYCQGCRFNTWFGNQDPASCAGLKKIKRPQILLVELSFLQLQDYHLGADFCSQRQSTFFGLWLSFGHLQNQHQCIKFFLCFGSLKLPLLPPTKKKNSLFKEIQVGVANGKDSVQETQV